MEITLRNVIYEVVIILRFENLKKIFNRSIFEFYALRVGTGD